MKWLITGGCGFLGTALIRKLLGLEIEDLRIIDNLSTGKKEDLSKVTSFKEISHFQNKCSGVELVVGDIRDEKLALEITKGVDIVVHFAANTGVPSSVENPRLDLMTNVVGTFNYLEAARMNNIKKFIFASSGAPAGEVIPPIHEELPAHPVSPYGASKLSGEGYCSSYFKTFNLETVALRFGNVYGPGSKHKSSVVAKFIQKALDGEVLQVYGNGEQTRDFIYIDDLIEAVVLAANKSNIGGEIFQIATSFETRISELVRKLVVLLEIKGVKNIKVSNVERRLGDVLKNYSDTTKAEKVLGWRASYSLEEGLSKTIEYFLESKR